MRDDERVRDRDRHVPAKSPDECCQHRQKDPEGGIVQVHAQVGGIPSRFKAVKVEGRPLVLSFVYELAGYTTTKSQVFQVGDSGITDLAVQFPTASYFAAAKGQIEQQIGALIGAPYTLANVLVTTVGKSWASMYSPELFQLRPNQDSVCLVYRRVG